MPAVAERRLEADGCRPGRAPRPHRGCNKTDGSCLAPRWAAEDAAVNGAPVTPSEASAPRPGTKPAGKPQHAHRDGRRVRIHRRGMYELDARVRLRRDAHRSTWWNACGGRWHQMMPMSAKVPGARDVSRSVSGRRQRLMSPRCREADASMRRCVRLRPVSHIGLIALGVSKGGSPRPTTPYAASIQVCSKDFPLLKCRARTRRSDRRELSQT
jgi:hypothetical protein